MNHKLLKTDIHLDSATTHRISHLSLTTQKAEATVIHEIIEEGLKHIKLPKAQSAQSLLELAGIIPKERNLSRDLSEKHNDYTWD